jgi:hypothetical protein
VPSVVFFFLVLWPLPDESLLPRLADSGAAPIYSVRQHWSSRAALAQPADASSGLACVAQRKHGHADLDDPH